MKKKSKKFDKEIKKSKNYEKEKNKEEINLKKKKKNYIQEHNDEILNKEDLENELNEKNNLENKEKLTEENIEIKKNEKKIFNVTFQEKNNKDKILIELKPIESYLRKKMGKMKEKRILNIINNDLQKSMKEIKEDFFKEKINFSKNSKSIDLESKKEEEKLIKNPLSLKIIKNIIKQEKEIKNELYRLSNNENIIKNQSVFALIKPFKDLEKINLNLEMIKINEKKEKLKNRLIELNQQILNIINSENLFQKEIEINKRNFIDNLEKNENDNKKIFKLKEESKIRKKKMENDLKKNIIKKKNILDNKEEEEENKKKDFLNKLKNNEKKNIEQRKNKNNQKTLKLKYYLNNKIPNNNYLYKENLKKFLENENFIIEKENLRRKNYMKQINLKEFLDFKKEIEKNKMKLEEEQIIKTKKLKELWNERSKLIPNYICPLIEKFKEENNNIINHDKIKNQNIIRLNNIKLNYTKNKIPKITKFNHNINYEKSFDDSSFYKSKNYSQNIFLKIKDKKNYNSSVNIMKKNNEEILFQFHLNKRKNTFINSVNNSKRKKENLSVEHKINDYLTEQRLLRNKSTPKLNNKNYNLSKNSIDILNSKDDFHKKINAVNSKLNFIDEKVKQKEKTLKYNGGIIFNPDLGNEICDLYLDSIHTKLNIIQSLDKK